MARGGRSRGRPRKGQSRMDAAIDAMKPYGYSEQLVVSTVNQLLDVYGVEGWPFIEEASYSVLLDTILEKDDEQTNEIIKDDLLGSNNEGVDNTKARATESSTTRPLPICSNQEVFPIELGSTVTQESASGATKGKSTEGSVFNGNLSNTEGEGSSCSKHVHIEQDHHDDKNQRHIEDGNPSAAKNVGMLEEEKAFPTRSHGPYHGWISDSDEPLQLIELKPARISRWDQLPQDIGAL